MDQWFEFESQQAFADRVRSRTRTWLVTGAAGFIGSNLVETLLKLGQNVVGFDNFATGYQRNLQLAQKGAGDTSGSFKFIEGDIRDFDAVRSALEGVEIVLHQAALGSVPRSIDDPRTSHEVNVSGFLNVLEASRRAGISRFVYAASSSTYGDEPALPKIESRIGNPLSPYAGTKLFNEIYADIWARTYDFPSTGLRYFNVFGQRQDPDGAYAAVIPKWISRMIRGDDVVINGDGETSRDFCYVANAVQANLRAALLSTQDKAAVYNVAVGQRTSLLELFGLIQHGLAEFQLPYDKAPVHADFRKGDVRHSLASIEEARGNLEYNPTHTVGEGLSDAMKYYVSSVTKD